MKQKHFQYEVQPYQENCVANIVSIFDDLRQGESFRAILQKHSQSNQYKFSVRDSKNIDIMMETGTGKTFTFIKTIFELNRNFGYKKFIILIPTVPIREGTKTNLEDTKDYFKGFYANEKEKEIETFVYEGGNVSAIEQYIRTPHLSVLILTPSSFAQKDGSKTGKLILNRFLEKDIQLDVFNEGYNQLFIQNAKPKTYLDCLKAINPIIIMDEPHRFDGEAFKNSFVGFDNYFLRFGATFPRKKESLPLSNVAYVLDSISSFRQSLVKKIVVYTQDVVEKVDTLIAIEKEGSKSIALVDTLTNGIIVKRKVSVGDKFNGINIKKINKDSIVLTDDSIEKVDYTLTDESLRAMIRQTIQIHFQKEQELFEKNIKALTLFFMESDTSLFRGDNPKVKTIFEEEYNVQRKRIIERIAPNSDYYKYLQKDLDADGQLQVHKGYFSGDKGNADQKVKAGVDEILKDKKKLLSFESPTRFIFSIWALQEGWDNPNVFTICKLSNQGSDISKLQQIGRGLRICVNQDLERQTLKKLGDNQEEFWKINNLDVVVSSKEQGFVEAIQNEILSNSFLISNTFTEKDLTRILQEKTNFDEDTIISLIDDVLKAEKLIVRKALIDGERVYEKSPDFTKLLKAQNLPKEQEEALLNLFATDVNEYIKNEKVNKPKKKVFIKDRHLQEFKNLWNTISKKATFVLENLSQEQENQLIQNIKTGIEQLDIQKILLQTKKAELNIKKLGSPGAINVQLVNAVTHKSKVDYLELVHSLSSRTKTPLHFVVKIFNALNSDFKNKMLCNNPEQAQKEIAAIINQNLIAMLKTTVKYDGISTSVLPNIFETENEKTYLATGSVGKFQKDITHDFSLKEKWVFEDVIEYDSDFELEIIEHDPDIESIEIFGKLPKLEIKTPLGKYNPDFCYAIKTEKGNKVFLIVEAKGYKTSVDIPENEKAKIDFAKKYFDALNEYYQNDNIKISFKERINSTQLVALLNESI